MYLTTCEKQGTAIKHSIAGTIAKIVGSYVGGFVVEVAAEKFMLAFDNIGNWEIG